MNDTVVTIIAIGIAAVLLFIFPLITMADRSDDISQLSVQTATDEFASEVRTTGKITESNYSEFVQTITSTGNLYDVEMEVQVKDENLGKKVSQAQSDKIGENVYYSIYTAQIENELDTNGIYYCKEGDMFSVNVHNTNQTIAQQLQNFFYTITGNDAYTIAASAGGIVTANGN